MAKDPTADNLAVFRQQALIVARRKDQAAERLTQLRAENDALEKQYGHSFPTGPSGAGGGGANARNSNYVPQGEEVSRVQRDEPNVLIDFVDQFLTEQIVDVRFASSL